MNLEGYRFDNVHLNVSSCQTADSTVFVRTTKVLDLEGLYKIKAVIHYIK